MAKSGMNALARVLAAEEKENGVAVWAVRPGVINVSS
jgi:NAD(P)-dependent dehydrogenase (short-subunit alcohol dehydrogenase family)